jgi:hypothetical protein
MCLDFNLQVMQEVCFLTMPANDSAPIFSGLFSAQSVLMGAAYPRSTRSSIFHSVARR